MNSINIHNVTEIKRSSRILKANKRYVDDVDSKVTEIVVTDKNGNRQSILLFHSTD
jgi:hypothetical protein